jgi:hypothetical protein
MSLYSLFLSPATLRAWNIGVGEQLRISILILVAGMDWDGTDMGWYELI